MLANIFSQVSLSPLVWCSTLYSVLLHMMLFQCGRYYFFVFFATPKPGFVQFPCLQICNSLTASGEMLSAVGSPMSRMCPMSYHPLPILLHAISWVSSGSLYHTRPVLCH